MSEFHFLRPLWLLALLPLGLLLWRLARGQADGDAWRRVVDPLLLRHLLVIGGKRAGRAHWLVLGIGWLLLVLALAGPSWERLAAPFYEARQYRVLALDLSPTMNAGDLAPSRLARARFELLDLLRTAPEGQTALLAYAAEPYVVAPLTSDVETIAAQVPLLETGLLPVGGVRRTSLALDEAGRLLSQAGAPRGQVILITDGVDDAAAAQGQATRLAARGYRVSVLGVGTDKGGAVHGPDGTLLKDDAGAIRLATFDSEGLRRLAQAGGGRFVTSRPDDRDIAALTAGNATAPGEPADRADQQAERWRDRGPWLLLALLPLAALAFRRGWLSPLLLMWVVLPVPDADAAVWDRLWASPDQQAQRLLEQGRAEQAAGLFERPDWRAAAQYRAGEYEQVLQALQGLEGVDPDYNRGNALARLDRLDEAVAAYDRVLAVDPRHEDAQHNRALLQRLIDRRRQAQQQAGAESTPSDPDAATSGQSSAGEARSAETADSQGQRSAPADPSQAQHADAASSQDGESGGSEGSDSQAESDGQDAAQAQGSGASPSRGGGGEDAVKDERTADSEGSQRPGQMSPQGDGRRPDGQASPPEGATGQQQPLAQDPPTGEEPQASADPGGSDPAGPSVDGGGERRDPAARSAEAPSGPQGGSRTHDNGPAAAPGLTDLMQPPPRSADAGPVGAVAGMDLEDRQAVEQMLRRVEDDPGGLLRQRFLLQHLRRNGRLP